MSRLSDMLQSSDSFARGFLSVAMPLMQQKRERELLQEKESRNYQSELDKLRFEQELKDKSDANFWKQMGLVPSEQTQTLPSSEVIQTMPKPRISGFTRGGLNVDFPLSETERAKELQYKVKEKKALGTAEQELKKNISSETIKKQRLDTATQYQNLIEMEKLAKKVPAGWAGVFSIGKEAITRGKNDSETREYLKEFPSLAVAIYRDVTGDYRLSDYDAIRAYVRLWHPSESTETRERSFKRIKEAYQRRMKLLNSGDVIVDEYGQIITPPEKVFTPVLSQTKSNNMPQIGETFQGERIINIEALQ